MLEVRRLSLGLGGVAGLAVLLTLGGPGVTVDEPLDVAPGRNYVATLRAKGWEFLDPRVVDKVYRNNAEHPPLGRWLLGIASILFEPFDAYLGGPDPYGVHAGRVAPALAFAALVAVVAHAAGRRWGSPAAIGAGIGLSLMPRAFAHAHLGALDTFIALFWVAAILSAARAIGARRPVAAMAGAGVVLGLALLTKIHGWLLPPIVGVWALTQLPTRKAVAAVGAWAMVGYGVFFAGWPWLWHDTFGRLSRYLGTGVARVSLRVEYLGTVYADTEVPWHYPWLYFAATVPVGLHALGVVGVVQGWRSRRVDPLPSLLGGAILSLLVLFSTRVAVYDGERLFLPAFPLWAVFIGLGFQTLWARARRNGRVLLLALLLLQSYGIATTPFGLSYYNALVGGLPGAQRLGLERTFWGDAIDPILLDALAERAQPGETAAVVPTLHHLQARALTTPALLRKNVTLLDESAAETADWVLVYRRTAYWKPSTYRLTDNPPAFLRYREGVWLGGLWRRPRP